MEGLRVCWPEPGKACLETFTARDPGPGEMRIVSEVTLISPGTERAFFLGLPNAQGRFPSYPGYSCVGTVDAVGDGVEGFKIGDRAAAMSSHASHSITRVGRCSLVPAGVQAEQAVFFSLASISLQGIRKARIELGESMAVLGLGLIGNLALQLGRLHGAIPAIGLEPDAGRRALAEQCGADVCLDPTAEGFVDALAEATSPSPGPAVVIEATGIPDAVNQALGIAAPGGRVVLLASTRGVSETNFYRDIHSKGLLVLGAHNVARPPHDSSPGYWTLPDDMSVALRLLGSGRLHVAPLTSEIIPAEKAPEAYAELATWRKDRLGVILRWR